MGSNLRRGDALADVGMVVAALLLGFGLTREYWQPFHSQSRVMGVEGYVRQGWSLWK